MKRNDVVIETPSGKLLGTSLHSSLADEYFAFKGIPFAEPPIGQLRFRDPEPIKPWRDIRDATVHGPIAAQYDAGAKKVVGSEDCLYLNVYTRDLDESSRASVMVWIHGGAYYYGSGNDDMFGPDYFLSKNIVLVTINHRLGVFGFLNVGDQAASGNQGLKDQVMALKWVQTHITKFGGDPANVTIFGSSTGAASVHYLAISPAAKGLFHKAICQSGNALAPLTMTRKPDQQDMNQFVERLGCKTKDPKAIVDFLKEVSFERLIEVQEELASPQKFLQAAVLFLPSVDDESEEPFMPIGSVEAAERGVQVPLIIGYNSMEGLTFLNKIRTLCFEDIDKHLENYSPPLIGEILRSNNLTMNEFRYLYFKNEPIHEKTLENLLEYMGDLRFVENIHRFVKIQVQQSSAPTYLYKLSYDKNLSLSKKQLNTTIKGANHGDELMYLFKANVCDTLNFEQLQEGTGSERVMKQMIELWTNFARTGRPTLEKSDLLPLYWQPVASDIVLRYLNIDEELQMENVLNIEQRYSCNKNTQVS